jgi:hypothetical protein
MQTDATSYEPSLAREREPCTSLIDTRAMIAAPPLSIPKSGTDRSALTSPSCPVSLSASHSNIHLRAPISKFPLLQSKSRLHPPPIPVIHLCSSSPPLPPLPSSQTAYASPAAPPSRSSYLHSCSLQYSSYAVLHLMHSGCPSSVSHPSP